MSSGKERIPAKLWNRHRATIMELYESQTLTRIIAFMKEKHGFEASRMAYKKKIGRWKQELGHVHGEEESVLENSAMDVNQREIMNGIDVLADISVSRLANIEIPAEVHQDNLGVQAFASHSTTGQPESRTEDLLGSMIPDNRQDTVIPQELSMPAPDTALGLPHVPADYSDSNNGVTLFDIDHSSTQDTAATAYQEAATVSRPESQQLLFTTFGPLSENPSQPFTNFLDLSKSSNEMNKATSALDAAFNRHASAQNPNIEALERTLAAYYFLLGFHNVTYLLKAKEFCKIVSDSPEASFRHQRLLAGVINELSYLETPPELFNSLHDLEQDIRTVIKLWIAVDRYDLDDDFESIMESFSTIYSPAVRSEACISLYPKLFAVLHLLDMDLTECEPRLQARPAQFMIEIFGALRVDFSHEFLLGAVDQLIGECMVGAVNWLELVPLASGLGTSLARSVSMFYLSYWELNPQASAFYGAIGAYATILVELGSIMSLQQQYGLPRKAFSRLGRSLMNITKVEEITKAIHCLEVLQGKIEREKGGSSFWTDLILAVEGARQCARTRLATLERQVSENRMNWQRNKEPLLSKTKDSIKIYSHFSI